ncbi:DUF309 domain-containing protein [Euzebya sp.]|uniref:DUF309 domain-containing protein n=1 Tax=Euzebya sp. TaxID=1971409 RepID=UPI0035128AFB
MDADVTIHDRDRNAEGRPENARPRDRFGAPLPRDAVDEMPDRVDPEVVCTSVDQAVRTARELFDAERFFEAHEFFEWAWKGPVTEDADRPFFKGLAQLAVGYTHTQRGNAAGATTLLQRGIDALEPFGPARHGIDVDRAAADGRRFLADLATTAPSPDLSFPRLPVAGGTAGAD